MICCCSIYIRKRDSARVAAADHQLSCIYRYYVLSHLCTNKQVTAAAKAAATALLSHY
jgi:hypothetical protein